MMGERDRQEKARSACARVRGRLEQLLDGGLEPLEEARDQGHLEVCEGCRSEEARWREVFGFVRQAVAPPRAGAAAFELAGVQRDLDARLAVRIEAEARERRMAQRLALTVAAAGLLGLLGLRWVGFWTEAPTLPSGEVLGQLDLALPVWSDLFGDLGSPR